jgi:hypothetical protein
MPPQQRHRLLDLFVKSVCFGCHVPDPSWVEE